MNQFFLKFGEITIYPSSESGSQLLYIINTGSAFLYICLCLAHVTNYANHGANVME